MLERSLQLVDLFPPFPLHFPLCIALTSQIARPYSVRKW